MREGGRTTLSSSSAPTVSTTPPDVKSLDADNLSAADARALFWQLVGDREEHKPSLEAALQLRGFYTAPERGSTPGEAREQAQGRPRKLATLARCPKCQRKTGIVHGRMAVHKLPPDYRKRCPGSRLHVEADGTVIEDPEVAKAKAPAIRRDRRNVDDWRVSYLAALARMPRSRALYLDANQIAWIWPLVMADPEAAAEWQAIDRADHWVALTSVLGHVLRGNVAILAGTCNTSPRDIGRKGNGGGKLQGMLAGQSINGHWQADYFWGRTRIRYSNDDLEAKRGVRLWRTESEPGDAQTWIPPQRGFAHCEKKYTAHCVESAELVAAATQRAWYKSPRLRAVRAALGRVVNEMARSWFAAASSLWGPKRTYWAAIKRSDHDRAEHRKATERQSRKCAESARALKIAQTLEKEGIIANPLIHRDGRSKSLKEPPEPDPSPPRSDSRGVVPALWGAGTVPAQTVVGRFGTVDGGGTSCDRLPKEAQERCQPLNAWEAEPSSYERRKQQLASLLPQLPWRTRNV